MDQEVQVRLRVVLCDSLLHPQACQLTFNVCWACSIPPCRARDGSVGTGLLMHSKASAPVAAPTRTSAAAAAAAAGGGGMASGAVAATAAGGGAGGGAGASVGAARQSEASSTFVAMCVFAGGRFSQFVVDVCGWCPHSVFDTLKMLFGKASHNTAPYSFPNAHSPVSLSLFTLYITPGLVPSAPEPAPAPAPAPAAPPRRKRTRMAALA